jgi:hypothetical protein
MKTTLNHNTKVKSLLTTFVLGMTSVSLVACSGQNFSQVQDAAANIGQSVSSQEQCEIDPVDYVISANVYDFEVTDNTNVNFGFNLANKFLKALGLNLNMSSGKMSLTMTVTSPLNTEVTLASVAGTSSYKSTGVGGSLDIGTISLGAGYMTSTPFATLTSNGLANGLSNATKKLASVASAWSTKIVQVENASTYIVGAGTKAGLQVGDQLAIYNIDNRWSGTPCTSELLISQKTTSTPVAIAQVIQTNPFNSVVQIVSRNWSDAIVEGAVAESYLLVGKNRVLNRSVRIGSVVSPSIPVSNGQSIDIQGFAQTQFPTIVDGTAGYYLHQ